MRSYSLNAYMNVNTPARLLYGKRVFRSADQIRNPARIFTFLDEREDSICDVSFGTDPEPAQGGELRLPSPRHRKHGNLMFADGHWQKQRWRYADYQENGGTPEAISARNQDLAWLWEHSNTPD
jgi:prepilin-type processing-associated H-X9-DG protein